MYIPPFDPNISGTITTQNLVPLGVATAGSAVELTGLNGIGNVGIQLAGTWTGNLSFQTTINGTDWVTLGLGLSVRSALTTPTFAPSGINTMYSIDATGYSGVRITALGAVTGTVTVTMRGTQATNMVSINGVNTGSYNALPVQLLNPLLSAIPSDDVASSAIAIRSLPQKVDRISFTAGVTNGVDSNWGALVGSIGTGQGVNQTGGNLVITSGTTARSETIIRSTNAYTGGIRLRVRNTLSQRIVNNNFFVELVDVIGTAVSYTITSATNIDVTLLAGHGFTTAINAGQSMYLGGFSGTGTFLSGRYALASVTGNVLSFTVAAFAAGTGTCEVFGWNYYQLLYTSTTATNANFDTQRKGWASGATVATINTTASPGHLAIITGNDLIATFSDQLVASATTIQQTTRATRSENVPDDISLRIQIRVANGSTAPATTTTWTIGLISVSNYAAQDVVVQDIRPMGIANAIPVEILRGVALATQPVSIVAATNAIAKAEDAASASGDTGVFILGVRRDAPTISASATGDYNEVATDRYGSLLETPRERTWKTYSSSAGPATLAASATDVCILQGNATNTVYLKRVIISGIQTTAGSNLVLLVKRSTANTGGTSGTMGTPVPHENGETAALTTGLVYTANPTTGTLVGNLRSAFVSFGSTTAPSGLVEWVFGDDNKLPQIVGVAQSFAINLNGATLTGGTIQVTWEWLEL